MHDITVRYAESQMLNNIPLREAKFKLPSSPPVRIKWQTLSDSVQLCKIDVILWPCKLGLRTEHKIIMKWEWFDYWQIRETYFKSWTAWIIPTECYKSQIWLYGVVNYSLAYPWIVLAYSWWMKNNIHSIYFGTRWSMFENLTQSFVIDSCTWNVICCKTHRHINNRKLNQTQW